MEKDFLSLASQVQIERTIKALEANGMRAFSVSNSADAKAKVLELIPQGAEVMNMTSVTADAISIAKEIMESGKFNPTRTKLMDKSVEPQEKKRLGGGPEWTIGSVHALTEDGKAIIASNTGSQIGAYAYGAGHVIWLVGAQKIVKDLDDGMKRIYEHVLPLESDRANKAYGITSGSNVSKLLIVSREIEPNRITVIIINEALGF